MASPVNQGNSITFDAVNTQTLLGGDAIEVTGMVFQGSGLTAGHRLLVIDLSGNVLTDYLMEAATDNADLWGGRRPQVVNGILVTNNAVGGTWKLTVIKNT